MSQILQNSQKITVISTSLKERFCISYALLVNKIVLFVFIDTKHR